MLLLDAYAPAGPGGGGTLVAAMDWIEGTLLGTVATSVAAVAVASVGLLMLSGRVDWRRGATVALGAFILFGAGSVAAGLRSAAAGGDAWAPLPPPAAPAPAPAVPAAPASPPPAAPPAADPYAGASAGPR